MEWKPILSLLALAYLVFHATMKKKDVSKLSKIMAYFGVVAALVLVLLKLLIK